MALGETEVRERLDLHVDVVRGLAGQAVARHPLVQLLLQRVDPLDPALRPHRAAQQVGILPRQITDGHAHLHELLLEHRDAERPLQHRLELRVRVGDRLVAELAPHERVHRAALDRPWTDERDLDHEIVELPRLQAGQQSHLRTRLDLEHPDRVGTAQHVVDRRFLLRHRVEVPLLPRRRRDHVEAVLQGGEHPEPQQVELHEPHPRGVVLVPLDDGAVLHARVLDRHDLADRTVRQHHPARVDAEMPGRLQQLTRVGDHPLGDVVVGWGVEHRSPALDLLRPGILLPRRVPEGLRHVADGVLRPVLDDVRDLRRPLAPVRLVDPLDDLLAPVRVEVDVDVGLLVAQRRQEPLERQVVEDRVDRGDVEQVADGTVRGGSPPLAEDAAAPRLLHDAVHDEEVPREVLLLDDAEFLLDARAVRVGGIRVLAGNRLPHEVPQPRHRRVPLGHLHLRQRRLRAAEGKRQLVGERDGALDRPRIPPEPPRHLGPRPQMRARMRGQPAVELVESAVRPHRRNRRREVHFLGHGVVHVVRRDDGQLALGGERGEHVVVARIRRRALVDELDVDPLGPEQVDEPVELVRRGGRAVGGERLPDGALAASGQHLPVPAGPVGEVMQVVHRAPLLTPRQLRVRDGGGESVVALLAAREHQQVRAVRIGFAVLRTGQSQRQLGPEDGLQLQVLGRLGEADDAVEPVVVGDREGVQTEAFRLFDEVLG